MKPWAKFPTWWYRDDEKGLHRLRGGTHAGTSQAALRVLLRLAVLEQREGDFIVRASLTGLEHVTQLSRPMVIRGVEAAVEFGFISVERGHPTAPSRYTLRCPEGEAGHAGGWAKLPRPEVIGRVPKIPHRGVISLVALKVYLTLVAARSNHSNVAQLRHITLRNKTGARSTDIRRAITVLGNEGLIDVNTEDPALRFDPESVEGRQSQKYTIRGKLEAPPKTPSKG